MKIVHDSFGFVIFNCGKAGYNWIVRIDSALNELWDWFKNYAYIGKLVQKESFLIQL